MALLCESNGERVTCSNARSTKTLAAAEEDWILSVELNTSGSSVLLKYLTTGTDSHRGFTQWCSYP